MFFQTLFVKIKLFKPSKHLIQKFKSTSAPLYLPFRSPLLALHSTSPPPSLIFHFFLIFTRERHESEKEEVRGRQPWRGRAEQAGKRSAMPHSRPPPTILALPLSFFMVDGKERIKQARTGRAQARQDRVTIILLPLHFPLALSLSSSSPDREKRDACKQVGKQADKRAWGDSRWRPKPLLPIEASCVPPRCRVQALQIWQKCKNA